MDVLPDEDELLIQQTTREFLADSCPPALARAAEKSDEGYSVKLWREIADMGWIGTSLPEAVGGQGLPLSFLGLIFEELGYAIAPVPFHNVVVSAMTLANHGSDEQKALLPQIIAGEKLITYGVQGVDGAWFGASAPVTATETSGGYLISGTLSFVDNFTTSDLCIVPVAVESGGRSTVALALVDPASSGVTAEQLVTTAKDRQSKVTFDQVFVPSSLTMPSDGAAALEELRNHASAFLAAQIQGAARKAVEMAIDYSKQRVAFEQPIGSFQALQHLAADMIIAVDGAQLLIREAIWFLGQGKPASIEVSQAKSFANERCLFACRSAQQFHGGLGFMMEFDLQLFYRRVTAWGLRCGTAPEHRKRVSAALFAAPGKVRLGRKLTPV